MPRKSKVNNSNAQSLYGKYSAEIEDENEVDSSAEMDPSWLEFKKTLKANDSFAQQQARFNTGRVEQQAQIKNLENKIAVGGTLTPSEEITYAGHKVAQANNNFKGLSDLAKQYTDAYQENVDGGITAQVAPLAGGMGTMGMGNYSQLKAMEKQDDSAAKMKDIENQIRELTGFDDKQLADYLEYNKRLHNAAKTDELNSTFDINPNDSTGKKVAKGLFNEMMSLGASYTPAVGNMASAIGATEKNGYKPQGFGEDVNSQYKGISNASNYAQQQIQNSINNSVGNFVQSVGHATLDSAVRTAPTMMLNAMTGGVASKALEAGTLLSYYQSSRDSAYQAARERGYSEENAQLMGRIGGAAEAALEMIPTGHILNNAIGKNVGKSAFLNILKGMNEEGLEELGTDVVNDLADYIFSSNDQFGESEFNQIKNAYINAGLDEEAATKKAIFDKVSQYGQDYAAGALSGGFMQGTSTAMGVAAYGDTENRIRENAQYTSDSITGDTEYDLARKQQADMYARNPARYIADTIDDSTEEGKAARERATQIANKEASGKKLSVLDKADLNNASQIGAEAGRTNAQKEYAKYAAEVTAVPKEYRTAQTGITAEEGVAKMQEAADKGDLKGLSDAYSLMKNSTSAEARDYADEALDSMKGRSDKIASLQIEGLKTTTQDAFLAGANGTERSELGTLSQAAQEAYDKGKIQYLEKNKYVVNNAESVKHASVTTEDGGHVLTGKIANGMVVTESGDLINIADTQGDSNIKTVYGFAAEYNDDIANTIMDNIQDGDNVRQYTGSAAAIISAGETGIKEDQMLGTYAAKVLGEDRARALYQAGARQAVVEKHAGFKVFNKESKGKIVGFTNHSTSDIDTTMLDMTAKVMGINIELWDQNATVNGKNVFQSGENARFVPGQAKIVVSSSNVGQVFHELGEFMQAYNSEGYDEVRKALVGAASEIMGADKFMGYKDQFQEAYANAGQKMTDWQITSEMANDLIVDMMSTDKGRKAFSDYLAKNYSVTQANGIKAKIKQLYNKIIASIKSLFDNSKHSPFQKAALEKDVAKLESNVNLFLKEFDAAIQTYKEINVNNVTENIGITYDAETESAFPTDLQMFSLNTFNASDYVTDKENAAKSLAKALDVPVEQALKYIDDVNSIAKIIADDRVRLDFDAEENSSSFVSNAEYGGSIDFSTICKKRLLYTGTMQEIQKQIGNRVITMEDYLAIRNAMLEDGLETTCGCCYVEGSRVKLGQFMKEFIKRYSKDNPSYIPTMYDVTMPDGIRQLRAKHPEVFEAREKFLNNRGVLHEGETNLFSSQGKPKDYTERTEYRGEILDKFLGKKETVAQKNLNGGLRLQSFSDFEIVNLLDCMQVITDMARCGLAGQAYTKVYDFADALGNTGLKINLSLMGAGVDANGDLVLDEINGMKKADAIKLRNKYSKNVGTIIVCFTDEQIKAAMKSDYIDFIIPFHRSQWRKSQYDALGLPEGTRDYTMHQNDRTIKDNGRLKKADRNYMPNEYWEYDKSGRYNAKKYIDMCNKDHKAPKFPFLLNKNSDGTYSLPEGEEYDGYFKLLIDFKMYDNDGVGAPQMPVTPNFSMEEAKRMLNEYAGGHDTFPVAQNIADRFAKQIIDRGGEFKVDARMSLAVDSEGNSLTEQQTEYFKDSKVRDENGNLLVMYHGTANAGSFNIFEGDKLNNDSRTSQIGQGFYFTNVKAEAESYMRNVDVYGKSKPGSNPFLFKTYLNVTNPFDVNNGSLDMDAVKQVFMDGDYDWYFNSGIPFDLSHKQIDGVKIPKSEIESMSKEEKIDLVLKAYPGNRAILQQMVKAFKYGEQSKLLESMKNRLGYDGIVDEFAEGKYQYVVFDSSQIKNVDNANPTQNPDIRYSISVDSDGNKLSENQENYFQDSKIRDENGNLLVMYHGTKSDFTVFDPRKFGGVNGIAEGYGIYLTDNSEVSKAYGSIMKVYANVTNPASSDVKSIKPKQLSKLIEATCKQEAARMMEEDGYASLEDALKDTWISNYVYTYDMPIAKAYMEVASQIIRQESSDFGIIQEVMSGMAIRDYEKAYDFYDILKEQMGIDGFATEWEDPDHPGKTSKIVLALDSNQVKNVDNASPTLDPDIRYSITFDDFISDDELSETIMEELEDDIILDSKWNTSIDDILAALEESINSETKRERKKAQRHLTRAALGKEFQVRDGKTVALTDERIEKYMHAFAASNKDYAQAYITYMSPADFLLLTANGNKGDETFQKIKSESHELDWDQFKGESQPIFLDLDEKGVGGATKNEIVGHEGRHRMFALQMAGYTKVPVLVFNYANKYSKSHIDSITVDPQRYNMDTKYNASNKITLNDLEVLSTGNQDTVIEKFGSGAKADVRYSLDPSVVDKLVDREYILNNKMKVANSDALVEVLDSEENVPYKNASAKLLEIFNEIGSVDTEIGSVVVDERSVRSIVAHQPNRTKLLAASKIDEILSKGKAVYFDNNNLRGKGYDVAVIATPISVLDGRYKGDYLVGAQINVNLNDNVYYLDELIEIKRDNLLHTYSKVGEKGYPSVITILQDVLSYKDNFSNIHPLTMDNDYITAVNSGDMIKAQQMVDEAAEAAGFKVKAYHGSTRGDITIFRTDEIDNNMGSHFGSEEIAKEFAFGEYNHDWQYDDPEKIKGHVYSVYLKADHPYETYDWFAQDDFYPMAEAADLADTIGTPEALAIKEEILNLDPEFREMYESDDYNEAYLPEDKAEILYRRFRDLLDLGGYDSILYENGLEIVGDMDYIIQHPNQIKLADPVTYDDNGNVIPLSKRFDISNPDIRYSIQVDDSTGKQLTPGQQEFFKNSKAVDENGRLKRFYHGARGAGFTVFNTDYTDDGTSFFFTDDLIVAKGYSGNKEIYRVDGDVTLDELSEWVDTFTNGDMYIEKEGNNYVLYELGFIGEDDRVVYSGSLEGVRDELVNYAASVTSDVSTNYEVYLNVTNPLIVETDGDQWDELPAMEGVKTDDEGNYTTRGYAAFAKENGYDGVIFNSIYDIGLNASSNERHASEVVVVFESNQIKSVNNENPTADDPDIRYSLQYDDFLMSDEFFSESEQTYKATTSILEEGMEALKHQQVDKKVVTKIASKLISEFGSTAKIATVSDELTKAFAYMQTEDHVSYDSMMRVMSEIARPIIDQATTKVGQEVYDDFLETFRGRTIRLSDRQKKEVASVFDSYQNFRLAMAPIQISDKGTTNIEDVWSELAAKGYVDLETTTEDMPLALYDLAQSLKPVVENEYGEDLEEASKDLAMRIVEEYLGTQDTVGAKVAADKAKAQLKQYRQDLKEQYKKNLQKVRADLAAKGKYQVRRAEVEARWREAELKKKQEEQLERKLKEADMNARWHEAATRKEIEDKYSEKIENIRARNKQRAVQAKERQNAARQRKMIDKRARDLITWITNPSEKNHVPEDLKAPIIGFLQSLDFIQPKITEKDGEFTIQVYDHMEYTSDGKKHPVYYPITDKSKEAVLDRYRMAVGSGVGSQNTQRWADRMVMIQDIYERIENADEHYTDYDMIDFVSKLDKDIATDLREMLSDVREKKLALSELSADHLRVINNTLANIMKAVRQGNRAFSMSHDMSELGNDTIATSKDVAKDPSMSRLKKSLKLDMATPKVFFKFAGKSGSLLYDVLREGFNTKVRDIKNASNYMKDVLKDVSKKEMKEWTGKDAKIYEFNLDGGTLRFTAAEIMSLYETMKRDGGIARMAGGIETAERMEGRRRVRQSDNVIATVDDLNRIIAVLTPKQIEVADKMQQYLAIECSRQGNEVSMAMFGYEKFIEEHYFPYKVDQKTTQTNDKNLNNAKVTGIEHSGFTKQLKKGAQNPLIMRDIFDVFTDHVTEMANYHGIAAPNRDVLRWHNYKVNNETVKGAVDRLAGVEGGYNYINRLLIDINQGERSQYIGDITEAIMGRYKAAAVSANIRVVLQQPTAIFRALSMVDAKYLNKAFAHPIESYRLGKMVNESSMIMWWKSQGYYETGIGKSMKEVITGLQSPIDQLKDKLMAPAGKADDITWSFLYNAVQYEVMDKNPGLSGEELRVAVNKRFDDVVDMTQVVDSTMHRSQLMRSKDTLNKIQTSFMAEPIKTYNMLLESAHDLAAKKPEAKAKAARVVTAIMIADIVNAAAQSLADTLRKKDDDDDWWEAFLDNMKGNFLDNANPLNLIPVVKDVVPTLWKALTGQNTYGQSNSRLDMAAFDSIADAITETRKAVLGESNKTLHGKIMIYAKPISYFTGVPVYNIYRDTTALYGSVFGQINKSVEKPNDKYNAIYDAMASDKDQTAIDGFVKQAVEKGGTIYDIQNGITNRYKSDYFEAYQTDPEMAAQIGETAAKGFAATGMSDEEIEKTINDWQEEVITYTPLDNAIKSGEGIKEAVEKVREGKDDEKIIKHLDSRFRSTVDYVDDTKASSDIEKNLDEAMRILDGRSYRAIADVIDKEAEDKAAKQALKEQKSADKESLYVAIDNGSDYKTYVDKLAKAGAEYKSIKSDITSEYKDYLVEEYNAGKDVSAIVSRIATVKAYCDQQSGFQLKPKWNGNYYEYEYSEIIKWFSDKSE